jgi:predicted AAA+ superfamily ATPase
MTTNLTFNMKPSIKRILRPRPLLGRKSHFLFGPRQTGKTYLLHQDLGDVPTYDMLDSSVFVALSRFPGRIGEEVQGRSRIVVIDEIQRLPELLHEVHRLIESRGFHFLLTGSSPRKLRRGGVNLLGGRARTLYLHPFCWKELGKEYDLSRAVRHGLLPPIYYSDEPAADLQAYTGTYLQQEIVAEGATRNVPAFSRFLQVAAHANGTVVNFTNIASDAQVPRTTVYEYFEILKDTLVIHELPAWKFSKKRKPLVSSKYYFFDVGVVGALQGREFRMGTTEFGNAFETLIMQELVCFRDYEDGDPLSFWRSASGFEVDFIIGDHTAVEVKAKRNIGNADLRSLRALAEENKFKRYLCVTLEARRRTVGNLAILPYAEFLQELWDGKYR